MLTRRPHQPAQSVGARLRDDSGMTLIELMVGMTVALVVVGAAFTAMTIANNLQTRTSYRIEALGRARNGMERITRDIRAQQCLGSDDPAVLWASDEGMEFYSSIAKERSTGQPVQKRRLEWIPNANPEFKDGGAVTGDIYETVWESPGVQTPYTFPTTPTSKGIVAQDVEKDGSKPIFAYYGYPPFATLGRPTYLFPLGTFDGPVALNPRGRPSVKVDDAARIVVVNIRFMVRSKRNKLAKTAAVPIFNSVSVRTADPTRPGQSPLC